VEAGFHLHSDGFGSFGPTTGVALGPEAAQNGLARGLENAEGANHCFLNVAIQALWNLQSFRTRFEAAPQHHHSPSPEHDEASAATAPTHCAYCALKNLFMQYQHSQQEALPPDDLRVALSEIYASQGRFQLGEMEDATETLEALLDIVHASSVGGFEESTLAGPSTGSTSSSTPPWFSTDLSAQASRRISGTSASGASGQEADDDDDDVWSPTFRGTDRARDKRRGSAEHVFAASHFPCQPLCIAHEAFGIEYVDLARCSFCGATGEPHATRSFVLPVYVAELEENHKAVTARDAGPTPSAPDLAKLLRHSHHKSLPGEKCKECNSLRTLSVERWLTSRPRTLVWSLIWPTSEPVVQQVSFVLRSITPILSVDEVFHTHQHIDHRTSPSSSSSSSAAVDSSDEGYHFCGMICYRGMHYIAIFWCWPLQRWVSFDDTKLRQEQSWGSVVDVVCTSGYIPTLLFYDWVGSTPEFNHMSEARRELVKQIEDARTTPNGVQCCTM